MAWTGGYAGRDRVIPAPFVRSLGVRVLWPTSPPRRNSCTACAPTSSPVQAGRIQAGEALTRSFVDTTAPADERLRYSIHRECVDARHRWQSAEVEWLPRRARPSLALTSQNPATERPVFEVLGTPAGPFVVEWYDLNGRRVATTSSVAAGSGRDVAERPLPQGGLWRTGVYLARARTIDGRLSPATKRVVVR